MRKFYTAEAVTEGHPDKLCDQIADAILDVCLKQDEQSRVACEVLATKGTIIVAGEITSTYEPDVFAVVRKVLSDVGYSSEGILDEGEAEDLQAYNRMSHLILKRCRMVVVCGKEVTGTMNTDISTADRLHIICTTLDGLIKIKEKEA